MKERQKELGIKGLSPEEVAADSSLILEWLKGTGASKVRVINDIASEYDLVGLTVAEPMPRIAIKLRNMLSQLPLLKA